MDRCEFDRRSETARGALTRALHSEFMRLQVELQLHPLLVLKIAAESLGAVYRDVAAAHLHDETCGCGWRPDGHYDIRLLRDALAAPAPQPALPDLASMITLGKA